MYTRNQIRKIKENFKIEFKSYFRTGIIISLRYKKKENMIVCRMTENNEPVKELHLLNDKLKHLLKGTYK